MKKVAILGTSNAIIKDGYHTFLREYVDEDLDVFSIGANSSLCGIYLTLKNNIIDNYEYVIIDYCINETHYVRSSLLSLETEVAYFMSLLGLFIGKKSIPLVLILSNGSYSLENSLGSVHRYIAQCFNVRYIDFEECIYNYYSHDKTLYLQGDKAHYSKEYQLIIAKMIFSALHAPQQFPYNNFYKTSPLYFNINHKDFEFINTQFSFRKTSIIHSELLKIDKISKIKSKSKIICGIAYWNTKETGNIYFNFSGLVIKKNLKLLWDGFFVRSIGYNSSFDTQFCEITTTSPKYDLFEETASSQNIVHNDEEASIDIADIIYSNISPFEYGKRFIENDKFLKSVQESLNCNKPIYNKLPHLINKRRDYFDLKKELQVAETKLLPSSISYDFFIFKVKNQSLSFYSDIYTYINKFLGPGKHNLTLLDVGPRSADGTNFLGYLYHKNSFSRIQTLITAIDIKADYKIYSDRVHEYIHEYIIDDINNINEKFDIVLASHVLEHIEDPLPFIYKLRSLATKYVIIYSPFMEQQSNKSLIPGHKINIDRNFILKLPVQNLKIFYSNVWHQSPVCIFCLPPL